MSKAIKKKAFIRSYGCVTPFGLQVDDFWSACIQGVDPFEQGLGRIPESVKEQCFTQLNDIHSYNFKDHNALFHWTLWSIHQALKQAGWSELTPSTGLIVATTTGLTPSWERNLIEYCKSGEHQDSLYKPLGGFAKELQNFLNHKGPVSVVSSACSAGTQALGMAKTWLELGFVERCLVVGAEQLCQLTENGFRSLSLVGDQSCKPFNEEFGGICLSEAAAVICMDAGESPGLAEVKGYSCTSDAHSMTAPKPDGSGPARAMNEAILGGGITPQELSWVHTHGTGSLQNDRAEAEAIKALEILAPVTSTKGVHGHSLAASGILESILCVKAIENQQLLPSWGAQWSDSSVNIVTELTSTKVDHIVKNSLGFGGVNASVLISRIEVSQ